MNTETPPPPLSNAEAVQILTDGRLLASLTPRQKEALMSSPGLSRGARILLRCRRSSRVGAIHPCRRFAARLLFVPLFGVLLALYCIGKLGAWLSDLECWTEGFADEWKDWAESPREIDIHRRAYRRAKNGKETK